jgi:hypothetical protein
MFHAAEWALPNTSPFAWLDPREAPTEACIIKNFFKPLHSQSALFGGMWTELAGEANGRAGRH